MEGYGQWAEHYRRALWVSVLPLPPRAKTPPPGGYTGRKADKIPDDAQIAEWVRTRPGGNLCLRMPGDVIGIDVDDYEYTYHARDDDNNLLYLPDGTPDMRIGVKTGNVTLGGLEDELGPLPATWRSSSRGDGPSGIRFYRVPSGLLWGDFGEHLECIWWGHRYAVVWPSVNPDSNMRYLWIDDREGDDAEWGAPPPKVTDLPDLPESWVARFGRPADLPKLPAPPRQAAVEVPRSPSAAVVAAPAPDPDRPHQFTREQAARYVETEGLQPLRSAIHGSINNRINDAAVVLSHFVPRFWSPAAAHALIWDAAQTAGYDDLRSATKTIDSGLSTVSWTAELVSEPARPPGGARTRPRDGQDDDGPAGRADDPPGPDTAGFWEARPILEHVRTYARAKYTTPWAVLGATLARAVAMTEPNLQLPDTISNPASLNMFVALVGPSGGGKDAAAGVSRRLLDVRYGHNPVELVEIPLGSGEGLAHVYMKLPPKIPKSKKNDDDSDFIGLGASSADQPVLYRSRALITVSEIDTLGALNQRQGSTIGGQLRQAWMGQTLGFQYATADRRMIVPEHAYRMCLVAGVQPGRAQTLLDETDGGTPQRFLWMPAIDPTVTRDAPDAPAPMVWTPPVWVGGAAYVRLCQAAIDTTIDGHIARQRGELNALDGHANLSRLKVAAALALLSSDRTERQLEVTDEDWELAGVVMAVSDHTRAGVQRHLAEVAKTESQNRAVAEGLRQVKVQETVEDAGVRKALRWLRGRLKGDEWLQFRTLKDAAKSDVRKYLQEALDRLEATGEVEVGTYTAGNNQTGRQVRRRHAE